MRIVIQGGKPLFHGTPPKIVTVENYWVFLILQNWHSRGAELGQVPGTPEYDYTPVPDGTPYVKNGVLRVERPESGDYSGQVTANGYLFDSQTTTTLAGFYNNTHVAPFTAAQQCKWYLSNTPSAGMGSWAYWMEPAARCYGGEFLVGGNATFYYSDRSSVFPAMTLPATPSSAPLSALIDANS